MMEAYSDWKLIYRNLDEVVAFASTIPTQAYALETRDEHAVSSKREIRDWVSHSDAFA